MNFLVSLFLAPIVLLAAFVLAAVLVYKLKVKRVYLYRLAASINRFPGRLRLKRQDPIVWQKAERAEQRISEFQAAGFVALGGFSIDELPNARLFALSHPGTGMVGVVNETSNLGTWSDVFLFPADGTQPVLASSVLKPGLLHFLPGDPKIHKPDATVPELLKVVQAAAGTNLITASVSAADFALLFEQAFAAATDTRLLSPLADYEIRRLLKEHGEICGDEISDKEFACIKELLPLAVENELRLTCGDQFLRETTLSATEWQHATQRLLIVHDRTPATRLAGKLIYGVFLTTEVKQRLRKVKPTGNPRADFASFNERLPAWVRYKKLGEVSRPVKADIYRAPIVEGTTQ